MMVDNDSGQEDNQDHDEDDILRFDFGRKESQVSGQEQALDTRDGEYYSENNSEVSDQDGDEDLGSPDYAREAGGDMLQTEEAGSLQ